MFSMEMMWDMTLLGVLHELGERPAHQGKDLGTV